MHCLRTVYVRALSGDSAFVGSPIWPDASSAVVEDRIRNALAMDYPRDKVEIAIASDGSTDRTNGIVRRFADQGVRLLDFPVRRGKAAVLNNAMQQVHGDIVLLSDANTHTEPNAARALVRWFADPEVGTVCGRLVLT